MSAGGGQADLESSLDDLYAAPLSEFVKRREALAASLREAGAADEAKRVKALRKPSVAAWAVNQLARRHNTEMSELVGLRERLGGAAGAAEVRAASERRSRLIGGLADAAREIMRAAGHPASPGTLALVTQTLYAGGSNEERSMLLRGRLERELSPTSGLEEVFGLMPDVADQATTEEDDARRREREELLARAEEAEAEADRLAEKAERSRAEAERLGDAAVQARREASSLRHEAAKLR